MKQALERDDLLELAELLTGPEAQIIFVLQNGRFATWSMTRTTHQDWSGCAVQEDPCRPLPAPLC
jgi:hypothetical protein